MILDKQGEGHIIDRTFIADPLKVEIHATKVSSTPQGWKYRFCAYLIESGIRMVCYDNHHGKGPHIDRLSGKKEIVEKYHFETIQKTINEFQREVMALVKDHKNKNGDEKNEQGNI